jgi:hypothetical protein
MFTDILKFFFERLKKSIADDASSKGQKAPVDKLRVEIDEKGGRLFAPHYFKYIITGRGPGKQPPPDAMLEFVQKNPEIYAQAKATFKYLTEPQLAYLIGRKIARQGTDIYEGKKPGIDLLGIMEKELPELYKDIARNEAIGVQTAIKSVMK